MRSACLLLTLALAGSGCDSGGPSDPQRIESNVVVEARSVDLVGVLPSGSDRVEIVFDFTGSLPAACYQYAGRDYDLSGTEAFVSVRAEATAETCVIEPSMLRVSRLSFTVPAFGPTDYTYSFERGSQAPIVVEVSL